MTETEIRIKNSRFIAIAHKVLSRPEASTILEDVRNSYPDANHHCFAYRLGTSGNDFRHDDDGEPTGTAGPPILRQIDSFELVNAMVVVVRYFGGTKLGAGGLIRAYGGAAREVLSAASIVETIRRSRLQIVFGYDSTAAVSALLSRYDAVEMSASYSDHTELIIAVPSGQMLQFMEDFTDSVRGQGTCSPVTD